MQVCLIDFTIDVGDWAPWLQAIGSIGAVIAVLIVAIYQGCETKKLARQQHKENLDVLRRQINAQIQREDRMYHRECAGKLAPILSIIETLMEIADEAYETSRRFIAGEADPLAMKSIRGDEATQFLDAINRIDVQDVPDVELVKMIIQLRNVAPRLVDKVKKLKASDHVGFVADVLSKLAYHQTEVQKILASFRERLDFHVRRQEESVSTID